jgi:Na+/proline symporter
LSASRFNRKARERLLYIATGLVILVILSIIIWIIPHVVQDTAHEAIPEKALPAFWVFIAIHLVLLAVLIWKILVSHRGGRLSKTGLIIPGIILILMSMLLIDEAGAYLEHQPEMFNVAILLFVCSFCDMIAGIITTMLPTRLLLQKH